MQCKCSLIGRSELFVDTRCSKFWNWNKSAENFALSKLTNDAHLPDRQISDTWIARIYILNRKVLCGILQQISFLKMTNCEYWCDRYSYHLSHHGHGDPTFQPLLTNFANWSIELKSSYIMIVSSWIPLQFYQVRLLRWISLAVSRHVVVGKSNLLLTSYFNLQENEAN